MRCEDNQAELGVQSDWSSRWLFIQGVLGSLSNEGVLKLKDLRAQPSKKEGLQSKSPEEDACKMRVRKTKE